MSDDLIKRMRALRDEVVWPHDEDYGKWTEHIVEVEARLDKLHDELGLRGKLIETLEGKLEDVTKSRDHLAELCAQSNHLRIIQGLESRLDTKTTALCTANDRYDTVVEERDAAMSRLSAISNALNVDYAENDLAAHRRVILAVQRIVSPETSEPERVVEKHRRICDECEYPVDSEPHLQHCPGGNTRMSALANRMIALRRRLLSADIDPSTLPPFAFSVSDVRELLMEDRYYLLANDRQGILPGSPVSVAGFRGFVVGDETE